MKATTIAIFVVLGLLAAGMIGVLLVLSASATTAASLPTVSAAQMAADAKTVVVAGTRSMEPSLHEGMQVIEKVPSLASELNVGNIIVYNSQVKHLPIIHRIIAIGSDDYGWYAITKGDNAPNPDDERVRFPQIEGVAVAIVQ